VAKGPLTVLTLPDGIELAGAFDAHVAAGGPGEPDALAEGRRLQLLVNALYSLTRGGAGSPWVDYLLAELRGLS
jgi:hypothetical protein